MCLLYKMYHRVDHPMNEYLNKFVAIRKTRASSALGELALAIRLCRTDQFSRPFLSSTLHLWNLLPAGAFSGGTLSSFKSALNLCLLRVLLDFLNLISVSFCSSITCLILSFWGHSWL